MNKFRTNTLIMYLGFGALTTLVNILVYWLLSRQAGLTYLSANIMAWVVSVGFAYATNHRFVFSSQTCGWLPLLVECATFFGGRLCSGLLDMGIMFVMIDMLQVNDLLVKLVANVVVISFNYLFSKYVVFQHHGQGEVLR